MYIIKMFYVCTAINKFKKHITVWFVYWMNKMIFISELKQLLKEKIVNVTGVYFLFPSEIRRKTLRLLI